MMYIKKQNNSLNKITDINALPSVYTTVLNKMYKIRATELWSNIVMRGVSGLPKYN